MTKREFDEELRSGDASVETLRAVINDEELYDCFEIYDRDDYDIWVDDVIANHFDGWRCLRDDLNSLPDGGDYFLYEDGWVHKEVDDYDVPDLVDDLEEYMERSNLFDEEEEDSEEPSETADEELPFAYQPEPEPDYINPIGQDIQTLFV